MQVTKFLKWLVMLTSFLSNLVTIFGWSGVLFANFFQDNKEVIKDIWPPIMFMVIIVFIFLLTNSQYKTEARLKKIEEDLAHVKTYFNAITSVESKLSSDIKWERDKIDELVKTLKTQKILK